MGVSPSARLYCRFGRKRMDIVIVPRASDCEVSDRIADILERELAGHNVHVRGSLTDLNLERDSVLVIPAELLQTSDQAVEAITCTDGRIVVLIPADAVIPTEVRCIVAPRDVTYHHVAALGPEDVAEIIRKLVTEIR